MAKPRIRVRAHPRRRPFGRGHVAVGSYLRSVNNRSGSIVDRPMEPESILATPPAREPPPAIAAFWAAFSMAGGDEVATTRTLRSNIRHLHPRSDQLFINFFNLPHGVGDAGGGAEGENNRMSFVVVPAKDGKVKIEMRVSAMPRAYNLRGKTGTPAAVGKYLGEYLRRIVRDVPPNFTHTR